jgi:hypothetical protein
MLVSRDWKILRTKECHELSLESSPGTENTTKMHNKVSPTHLEGSLGPNLDPNNRDFPAGNKPLQSPLRPL